MHEGERRGRGKGVAARVGAAEIAAMGKGNAQEGRLPSHRNAPSGHSGVSVGLFYAKSTQYSLLQNARPSGSLRSPCGYRGAQDPSPSVPYGCRNVREGDAAENGGEERRKVVEIMTCL